MSDTPSNNIQSNEDDNSNPLAKAFFDKLRKDGPKRDRVGIAYVRHLSAQGNNPVPPPSVKSEEANDQSDFLYEEEEEDKPSGARLLRQLRQEIKNEFSDLWNKKDSNSGNPTNES
ncbi:MAG: hypothetical protein KGP35_08875 [Bacteroidetes bacterium]|nr:hypothetical protein [Bacteroidota bacterium]